MSDYSTPAEDVQRGVDPAPGLVPCPRCTDGVVDLAEHLTWCKEPEAAPAAEQDEAAEKAARVAAARTLLDEDRKDRMAACLADIEAVLDKHGMNLDLEPARIIFTPRD